MKKSIKMQKEAKTTINDVLLAVNKLSMDIDQRLDNVENDLKDVKNDLAGVKNDLAGVKNDLRDVKATINTQVVKKTDLDDKFAEFGIINNYKHKRVDKLTNLLHKKQIITTIESQAVLSA